MLGAGLLAQRPSLCSNGTKAFFTYRTSGRILVAQERGNFFWGVGGQISQLTFVCVCLVWWIFYYTRIFWGLGYLGGPVLHPGIFYFM